MNADRVDDLPLWAPEPAPRSPRPPAKPRHLHRLGIDPDPIFGKPTGPGVLEFTKRALLEHVLELARVRVHTDPPGFTADDVRYVANEHQIGGTGEESDQRAWSWIGLWLGVLARRGCIAVLRDEHGHIIERKSERKKSHGNWQIVYTAVRK